MSLPDASLFSFWRYALDMRRERKITRLREYDYRQNGAYAVTLCVHERRWAFGKVENSVVRLNQFGQVAMEHWLAIPQRRLNVELDGFVIIPNHIHGILLLRGQPPTDDTPETRQFGQAQRNALGSVIGSYKSGVTRNINALRGQATCVWQSRFYEHTIRHDQDLEHQRQYIVNNPLKWTEDEFYVAPS